MNTPPAHLSLILPKLQKHALGLTSQFKRTTFTLTHLLVISILLRRHSGRIPKTQRTSLARLHQKLLRVFIKHTKDDRVPYRITRTLGLFYSPEYADTKKPTRMMLALCIMLVNGSGKLPDNLIQVMNNLIRVMYQKDIEFGAAETRRGGAFELTLQTPHFFKGTPIFTSETLVEGVSPQTQAWMIILLCLLQQYNEARQEQVFANIDGSCDNFLRALTTSGILAEPMTVPGTAHQDRISACFQCIGSEQYAWRKQGGVVWLTFTHHPTDRTELQGEIRTCERTIYTGSLPDIETPDHTAEEDVLLALLLALSLP